MKLTALLATALGLAGFGAGRWLLPPGRSSPPPVAVNTVEAVSGDRMARAENTSAKPSAPEAAVPTGARPNKEEIFNAPEGQRLEVLLRWLAAATAEEVEEMAATMEKVQMLSSYQGLWAALATRWTGVNPEAALSFARRLSLTSLEGWNEGALRGISVRIPSVDVYKTLLKLNPELALAKLTEEPPQMLRQLLRQLQGDVEKPVRQGWAASNAHLPEADLWAANPEEEARLAQNRKRTDLHGLTPEAEAIKERIGAKDLEGSRKQIDAMPLTYQRAMLEMEYVSALARQKSAQEAVDWAKANLKGLARVQAITLAAKELSKTDAGKALAMLRDHKIPDLGLTLVGIVDVTTPGTSSTSYRRNSDMTALKEIVSAAAKTDPRSAMDYLLSSGGVIPRDMQRRFVDNDDTTNQGSLGRTIYREWVASDPRAAALWLAAQPSSKGLSEMLPLLAGPLSAQNGAEGRDFVLELPQGTVRQELIGYAAAEWAVAAPGEEGGAEALQWAANAGGAPALSGAFAALTRDNAEVASRHFSLLPPETQAEHLQSLTDAIGRQKPRAMPPLYAGLPEETRSELDLREAVTGLAKENVEQASSWLNEIPAGKARDTGISGLVDYLIRAPQPDPEAAAHWAAASADPAAQSRRLQRVAEAWQQQNPGGVTTAITSSNLAEPVRQQLLGFLKGAAPGVR